MNIGDFPMNIGDCPMNIGDFPMNIGEFSDLPVGFLPTQSFSAHFHW